MLTTSIYSINNNLNSSYISSKFNSNSFNTIKVNSSINSTNISTISNIHTSNKANKDSKTISISCQPSTRCPTNKLMPKLCTSTQTSTTMAHPMSQTTIAQGTIAQ